MIPFIYHHSAHMLEGQEQALFLLVSRKQAYASCLFYETIVRVYLFLRVLDAPFLFGDVLQAHPTVAKPF